jgi:hypothetical protein
VKRLVILGALLGAVCLLATSACDLGTDPSNRSATHEIIVYEVEVYLPDSTMQTLAVDKDSVTLPTGHHTQVWHLAATDEAWYALTATRTHWTLVEEVTVQLTDGSDSTFAAAKSFVDARGDVVTSRWIVGSRKQFQGVDVNVNPTNPHGYVTADVLLPAILRDYARGNAFIFAISLPDRTPITCQ